MPARYYIQAHHADGSLIPGNLDGQASLGAPKFPTRCAMWRHLTVYSRPHYPRVAYWTIINSAGEICARHDNPKYKRMPST